MLGGGVKHSMAASGWYLSKLRKVEEHEVVMERVGGVNQ